MPRSLITALALTDYRSYGRAELHAAGRTVYLHGPNGAGKTNILEAVSLLSPGKGLRGSALAEVGRREPDESVGRAWAVSALIETDDGEPTRLGTGTDTPGAARRLVRVEGEPAPPGRLTEYVRPLWLTPAQDRLFLEAAGDRRRFLDRLVHSAEPAHAAAVAAYERALRERMRLLTGEEAADPVWLTALEGRMAEAGALMALARARTLTALQAEIDQRADRPFPQAQLGLSGDWERMALQGAAEDEIAARLNAALAAARSRDAAAGRGLTGPHRGDLEVIHRQNGRPAAEGSTGEQKALILNLVLAQAARLSRAEAAPNPILLLDEVAAHLDPHRRAALFDEITALGLQAFLTGTDESLFASLKGRALGIHVHGGQLHPTDD